MSTLTKSWLKKQITDLKTTRDEIPFGLDEDGNNTLAALKLALAGMEAEPVGVTDKSEIECLKRGEMANVMPPDYKGCDSGDSVYLYDAPQPLTTSERAELENYRNAQVVPGERPAYEVGTFGKITINWNGHSLDFDVSDFDFKDGTHKQDSGFIWKKGLQGIINAIQAHCDSLPNGIQGVAIKWDSENHPVAMQPGEVKDGCEHEWVHHVPCLKPEYDQCSKCNVRREMFENCWVQSESQAGNSPVIPDGWVMVPEEPTHEMLEAGDEQFGTYDVYRRMLSAAPHQEAE